MTRGLVHVVIGIVAGFGWYNLPDTPHGALLGFAAAYCGSFGLLTLFGILYARLAGPRC